jgi:hypothetical protein
MNVFRLDYVLLIAHRRFGVFLITQSDILPISYSKSTAKQIRMKATIIAAVAVEQTYRSRVSSSGGSSGESMQHPHKRNIRSLSNTN